MGRCLSSSRQPKAVTSRWPTAESECRIMGAFCRPGRMASLPPTVHYLEHSLCPEEPGKGARTKCRRGLKGMASQGLPDCLCIPGPPRSKYHEWWW